MAKRVFKYSDFADMMEKYDPFALKKENGEICLFDDYKSAYEYTFKRLFEKYPRGYIDLVLFVHEETGISYADAEREVRSWRRYCKEDVVLVEWAKRGAERNNVLKDILFALHLITETSFSESAFREALLYLDVLVDSKSHDSDSISSLSRPCP